RIAGLGSIQQQGGRFGNQPHLTEEEVVKFLLFWQEVHIVSSLGNIGSDDRGSTLSSQCTVGKVNLNIVTIQLKRGAIRWPIRPHRRLPNPDSECPATAAARYCPMRTECCLSGLDALIRAPRIYPVESGGQ